MEWRLVERKMQATIARLQAQAQDAADGKEQALQRLEEVTLRLKAVEREVADVTSLYRDAKAGEQPRSSHKYPWSCFRVAPQNVRLFPLYRQEQTSEGRNFMVLSSLHSKSARWSQLLKLGKPSP